MRDSRSALLTQPMIVDLLRHMFMQAFWLCLPVLAAGLVVGVAVSLLQILTSIQDAGVAAVPRLAALLTATLVALPWMLARLISYCSALFSDLGRFAR